MTWANWSRVLLFITHHGVYTDEVTEEEGWSQPKENSSQSSYEVIWLQLSLDFVVKIWKKLLEDGTITFFLTLNFPLIFSYPPMPFESCFRFSYRYASATNRKQLSDGVAFLGGLDETYWLWFYFYDIKNRLWN